MTDSETLDALAEEFADLRVELQPLLGLLGRISLSLKAVPQ